MLDRKMGHVALSLLFILGSGIWLAPAQGAPGAKGDSSASVQPVKQGSEDLNLDGDDNSLLPPGQKLIPASPPAPSEQPAALATPPQNAAPATIPAAQPQVQQAAPTPQAAQPKAPAPADSSARPAMPHAAFGIP